jgi:Putative zinc binding domain
LARRLAGHHHVTTVKCRRAVGELQYRPSGSDLDVVRVSPQGKKSERSISWLAERKHQRRGGSEGMSPDRSESQSIQVLLAGYAALVMVAARCCGATDRPPFPVQHRDGGPNRVRGEPDVAPLTETFVDLGMSPLCESYVPEDRTDAAETFYPLHVRICSLCLLVQLPAYVAGEDIYSDYAYFSSYSDSWVAHAKRFADRMTIELGLTSQSLVTEVASNDGYLLQHFVATGIPVLGVEPAANIAVVAEARGIPTEVQFLGTDTGHEIGAAGPIWVVANNVFAHVPDMVSFAEGLPPLVKETGLVTIEVPHLLRLIEGRQYDTIYQEHYQYYSLLTASRCSRPAACGSSTSKS